MSTLDGTHRDPQGKNVLTLQSIVFKYLLETCTQNMTFKNQSEALELLQKQVKKIGEENERENTYRGIKFRGKDRILLEMTPEKREKIDEFYELMGGEEINNYQFYDSYQDSFVLSSGHLSDIQFFNILANFEKINIRRFFVKEMNRLIEISIEKSTKETPLIPHEMTFLNLLKKQKDQITGGLGEKPFSNEMDHHDEIIKIAYVIFYSGVYYTERYLRDLCKKDPKFQKVSDEYTKFYFPET